MPTVPKSDDALLAECDVETLSAGTKGGQRANKVETGVRLTHRPSGLRVQRRRSRSQARNKAAALAELRRLLHEAGRPRKRRRATKPTKGSKQRRLDAKRRRSEKKALRQKPDW
jgi:protein subunit release factor A